MPLVRCAFIFIFLNQNVFSRLLFYLGHLRNTMKHAAKQTLCAHPPCQSFHFASLFALLIQHLTFIFHLFSSRAHYCMQSAVSVGHTAHRCHFAKWCKIIISRAHTHDSQDFPLHLNLHYLQSRAKCCLTLMAYARMCDDSKCVPVFVATLTSHKIAQQWLLAGY